jgi:hypothetical protein
MLASMEKKPKRTTTPAEEGIELAPDAWERFDEFVKRIAKAGPQHRPAKKDRAPSPAHGGKRGGSKPV